MDTMEMVIEVAVATTREEYTSIARKAEMWGAGIGGGATKITGMGIITTRSLNQILMWN